MKLLAIETYAMKPHLETSGEILIDSISSGQSLFCYVGDGLPWQEYAEKKVLRRLFVNMPNRVRKFEKELASRGVSVLSPASLSQAQVMEINNWAASFSGDVNALKEFSYRGYTFGLGVASSLISKYRNPKIDTQDLDNEVRNALKAAAIVFERALAVIKLHKPDVVLTFNGRFACSYPIIKAAQEAGVKVRLHERGSDYSKYEVFESSVHALEALRQRVLQYWDGAPDDASARLHGESFFTRRRCGDGIGWKSFTTGQVRGQVIPTNGQRRVVYFSSSDDEFAAVEDASVQKFSAAGQKAAVQRLINICKRNTDIDLIIRVHPNAAGCHETELAWWYALARQGVTVVPPLAKTDTYGLAETAEVVCTYGSTMGVEAAYWGTPSILLGDAGYSGFGCCFEPKDDEELESLLQNTPTQWDRDGCIKYGYYVSTFGNAYKYYEPRSFFEGSFLGNELSHRNVIGVLASNIYQKFLNIVH